MEHAPASPQQSVNPGLSEQFDFVRKLAFFPSRVGAVLDRRLPAALSTVYLDVNTDICNHACTFCDGFYRSLRAAHLPWPRLERLVDEMQEIGVLAIVLAGDRGEPFLHPDFGKLLSEDRAIRHSVRSLHERDMYPRRCLAVVGTRRVHPDFRRRGYRRHSSDHARLSGGPRRFRPPPLERGALDPPRRRRRHVVCLGQEELSRTSHGSRRVPVSRRGGRRVQAAIFARLHRRRAVAPCCGRRDSGAARRCHVALAEPNHPRQSTRRAAPPESASPTPGNRAAPLPDFLAASRDFHAWLLYLYSLSRRGRAARRRHSSTIAAECRRIVAARRDGCQAVQQGVRVPRPERRAARGPGNRPGVAGASWLCPCRSGRTTGARLGPASMHSFERAYRAVRTRLLEAASLGRDEVLIRRSGLFDPEYYRAQAKALRSP